MRLCLHVLESRDVSAATVLSDLSGEVLANIRAIALSGRVAGMNPQAFMKAGDSNTYLDGGRDNYYVFYGYDYAGKFFGPAGTIPSSAGLDPAEATTVGRFAGSFTRRSLAAGGGWSTRELVASVNAEIDAARPSVAFVTIGTNDRNYPFDEYAPRLAQVVRLIAARGVVPVLTTLPALTQQGEASDATARAYNVVIERVAADQRVPVLDLRAATYGLPNHGLAAAGLHLNVSPNGGGSFTAFDRAFGQNQRGYVTIQALTRVVAAAVDYDPNAGDRAAEHWTPFAPGQAVFAVSSDAGQPGEVAVIDTDTRAELGRVRPFERTFLGGVKVAVADVTGDAAPDLVVAAGFGGGPVVAVYDGATGREAARFFAYEPGLRTGVNIAAGDTDGDGAAEIVVGSGAGGGPRVRVFRRDGGVSLDFFAFEADLRTGVTVAAVGDGVAAGAGVGGGPVVKVFDGRTGEPRAAVFAYDPAFRGGVTLAGGDLDGDGKPELATAPGPGGGPHVRLFDPATLADRGSFFGDSADPRDGTRLAVSGRRVIVATGLGRPLAVRHPDGSDAGSQGLPDRFPFAAAFVG